MRHFYFTNMVVNQEADMLLRNNCTYVVVQSYAGEMSLSVTAEKWAVPDPDSFLIWVMEEYERLRQASVNRRHQQ
jgi:hypothetical protein